MVPALCRSLAVIVCLLPALAWALGVGAIEVSSGLNQPLDARIPIIGAKPGELAEVDARLAGEDVFARAGLPRSYALTRLKFQVVATGEDTGYIHVTSHDGIREPALEFIVDVRWRNGNLRRSFTVLLERK